MYDLPAVAIEGLKGVGKTNSAVLLAKTSYELDRERDFLLVRNDLDRLSRDTVPVLIDEWQRLPAVWDYIRREVDRDYSGGRFLLTGSVSEKDLNVHSGAGRIVKLRMFPLSLEERRLAPKCVSLGALLAAGESCSVPIGGETSVGFERYIEEIALSGLPGARISNEDSRRLLLSSYLDNLLTRDFVQEGISIRQPRMLMRWLTAYAAAIATTAGYSQILDTATAGFGEKPNIKTTIAYREALERLWLIDELPAWLGGESYYARLKKTPKHFLADPAFAVNLLGICVDELLGRGRRVNETAFDKAYGSITGRLFESLLHQSLKSYALVNDAELFYFHTHNGSREIDFILTKGVRTIAIEVKAAPDVSDGDVRHLLWLRDVMGGKLDDMLAITTGPVAYRRSDGVAVVPAALLGC
jgi:predicted AAA+ superfamily ATPase